MSFKTFFSELLIEERKSELNYVEHKTKGAIDKVSVELKGTDSAAMTKLAKRFKQISKAVVKLEAAKKELNTDLTSAVENLFDGVEDEIYTRLVETASFTVQLSKQAKAVEKTEIDYENLLNAVLELVDVQLQPKIDELFTLYTKKWTEKPRKPTLTVNQLEEGVGAVMAGLFEKISSAVKHMQKELKSWGKSYDARLRDLKKELRRSS